MNAASEPITVLYMEDDLGLARLMQRRLVRCGYVVDVAGNGNEGLSMYEAGSYQVLLVDNQMPGCSGLEVIRMVAAKGSFPPIVMITGTGDERIAVEAMKLGAVDYVVKDPAGGYLELMPLVVERALANDRLLKEKRQAEMALRESEELLRLITDALPVCISYTDASRQYLFNNKTYEDWFGKSIQEITGHHVAEVWGEQAYGRACRYIGEVLGGKEVVQEETLTFDDGTTRHLSIVRVPHLERQNTVKGFVSLCNDITERKRAEEALQKANDQLEMRVAQRTAELAATNEDLRQEIRERTRAEAELRESEERFRAIFETAQDCIFVKDRALCYTQVNAAMGKLFGVPVDEIVGTTASLWFDEHVSKQIEEVDRRVLHGEFIEETATRILRGIPVTFHNIRVPLRNGAGQIIGLCGISRDVTGLKPCEPDLGRQGDRIVSPAMRKTLTEARLAAETDSVVLLLGESGSGKDYLARVIHDSSRRASGPFFSINCAAVAAELAEAELFGYEAGAFTGAQRRKRGLLELAEGGTLLLNEIGELPLRLQAKLLTFLDTRAFARVGGETNVRVNARLIAATNRELEREVKEGRFRNDLYYRLNVFSITIPPLRQRREDLPSLVQTIMKQVAADMQLPQVPQVNAAAMSALAAYNWPGNVRELRNVIERSLILSEDSDTITVISLALPETVRGEWSYAVTFPEKRTINDVADDVKRALLMEALNRCPGSKQAAADMLGISRYALFRLMKTLSIDGT